MPHLGVLAQVHPQAATEVFWRDCLVPLGTVMAPVGRVRPGRPCLRVEWEGGAQELLGGELKLLPLGEGESRTVTLRPAGGLDVGAGPGRPLTAEAQGGVVGLILDGRGRPLALPAGEARTEALRRWQRELDAYPEEGRDG